MGAGSRYIFSLLFASTAFPYGTLLSNTLGCFVLGVVWQYAQTLGLSEFMKLLLIVGICGSLTTFSSVILEIMTMIQSKELIKAAMYFSLVNAIGFLALFVGMKVTA